MSDTAICILLKSSFHRLYKLKGGKRKRGCQKIVIIYFDWLPQLTSTVCVKPLPAHIHPKLMARPSIIWSSDCPELIRWIWSVQCQPAQGTDAPATSKGIASIPNESSERIKPCWILFLDERNQTKTKPKKKTPQDTTSPFKNPQNKSQKNDCPP